MDEGRGLSQEALQQRLSVAAGLGEGAARADVLAQLRAAPSAALFILSRRARSEDVRREAGEILSARLREDAACRPEPSPSSATIPGELPAALAAHRHFYKFSEHERWVLATRSGIRVATFNSEAELDRWWRGLKKQRGRILTKVGNPRRK
jgi:hypothetical protein